MVEYQVWFVNGDTEDCGRPMLWRSKEDAERWARELYPSETPEKRYARVCYFRVHTYASNQGD